MEPVIAVASGKGGTGKTTFAVNFVKSIDNKTTYIDADVEEPNGHIFLKPVVISRTEVEVMIPKPDITLCTGCGYCSDICKFNALILLKDEILVFPELCHGCGACILACPNNALRETTRPIGEIRTSITDGVGFIEGRLNEGEAKAPPVIRKLHTLIDRKHTQIIDVSPGTSCTAIEGIKKSDFVVLVTEPTPFGLHDLKLAVEVVRKIGLPCGVVINKANLGDNHLRDYCIKEGIPILMEIPFSREIANLYSKGELLVTKLPSLKEQFIKCYDTIKNILKEKCQ
jgi:MinD superfamily P-loop ATPase